MVSMGSGGFQSDFAWLGCGAKCTIVEGFMEWVTVSNRTDYVSVDRSVVAVYYISDDKVVLIDAGGAKSEELRLAS